MHGSCKQCLLNYTEGIRYQARHCMAQTNTDRCGFVVFIEYSIKADSSSQVSLAPNADHYTVSAGYIIGASQVKVPGPNVEWRAERQHWAGLGKLDIVFRYNNWGAAEHGGLSLRTDTARPLASRHHHRLSRKIVYLNKPQQPPSQPQIPSLKYDLCLSLTTLY